MDRYENLSREEIQMRLDALSPLCGHIFKARYRSRKHLFMQREYNRLYDMLRRTPKHAICNVDPHKIQLNPDDYRIEDPASMQVLKDSIKKHGQMMPILITDDYIVIHGNRRLIACRELDLSVRCRFGNPENA